MRRDVVTVFFSVIFALVLISHLAAQDLGNPPTLSVAPFSGSKAQIPDWQPALGQCVSEMLIEALENSGGKFKVLQLTEAAAPPPEVKPGRPDSANDKVKPDKDGSGISGKPDAGGAECSDFTFYGDVTQLTIQTNSSHLGDFLSSSSLANVGVKVVTAHVQLEWCITDTGTKKVIQRGTATGLATGSALNMAEVGAGDGKTAKASGNGSTGANHNPSVNDIFNGLGKALGNSPGNGNAQGHASNEESGSDNAKGGSATAVKSPKGPPNAGSEVAANSGEPLGYEDPEFMNSAFGKATSKAIANIVGHLAAVPLPESSRAGNLKAGTEALKHTPGKVLAVAGKDTIIVSLGGKQGFKAGDKLMVYQTNDVKDEKGNVVYSEEKAVGELTIVSVQDDRCRASNTGDFAVQQGWTVKAK
jgi:curli biogenesis system outer membrane secretion channel CsgG